MKPPSGEHVLATFGGCAAGPLDDERVLRALVERAVTAAGARVIEVVSHRFEPHGVTVVALLAESHASLHTYPEAGVAFWDCFTCGASAAPALSVAVLQQGLAAASVEDQHIHR